MNWLDEGGLDYEGIYEEGGKLFFHVRACSHGCCWDNPAATKEKFAELLVEINVLRDFLQSLSLAL